MKQQLIANRIATLKRLVGKPAMFYVNSLHGEVGCFVPVAVTKNREGFWYVTVRKMFGKDWYRFRVDEVIVAVQSRKGLTALDMITYGRRRCRELQRAG